MDTTYTNPNANYFQPGQGGNPLPANLPAPSTSTMSADKITQPSTLNLQSQTLTPIPDITNITSTQAATAPTPVTPTPTTPSIADRLTSSISNLFGQSKNKEADLAVATSAATLPLEKQINEISTQIKMDQAKALANQEAAARSGETTGFASREQQNIARTDAINALKNAAILEGLQGNLAIAEKHATNAINAKYADINKQIEDAKTNIYNNYDSFSPAEKKKADQTLLRLDAQDAFVKQRKEDEKSIQQIGITLAGYGVDTKTIQSVMNAPDFNTAIKLAGSNLQDPAAKVKLEGLRIDNALGQAQLKKSQYELQLLQQYGGLSPTEYAKKLSEEKKAIEDASTEQEKTRLQAQALDQKITLLGSVLDSSAIDSVVGPNALSRGATGFGGFLGRFSAGAAAGGAVGAGVGAFAGGVGAVPGAIAGALIGGTTSALQGSKDYFTGAPEKLIGQTEQFISKEFLQNLIEVKAQGATFGALQKPEQDALTAAATYIGQRRIYSGKGEDKQVVGYDMSEADFRRELQTIQDLTRKAYERATGKILTPDEQSLLDTIYSNPTVNPSLYY